MEVHAVMIKVLGFRKIEGILVPKLPHHHRPPLPAGKKLPQRQRVVACEAGVWAQKFLRAANWLLQGQGGGKAAERARLLLGARRPGKELVGAARLLYDVKSSWSATAAAGQGRGLLHHHPSARHHLWERAQPPFPRSGFQAQQAPAEQPPGCSWSSGSC